MTTYGGKICKSYVQPSSSQEYSCKLRLRMSTSVVELSPLRPERLSESTPHAAGSTVGRTLALFVHLSTKLEHASKRSSSLQPHPIGLVQTQLVLPLCLPFLLKFFRVVLTRQSQSKGTSSTSQRVAGDAEESIIHSFNQRRRRDFLMT